LVRRDWTNASIAYAHLVKETVQDGTKDKNGEPVEVALDVEAQRNVLNLAVAYALGSNQPALKDLRKRFLGRMAKTNFKASFDVVTAPSGNIPDDFRVISSKVAEVDQFRAFMKSYREKLMSRGKTRVKPQSKSGTKPGSKATPGSAPSVAAPGGGTQG
jgi:hypothetical protein